MEAADTVGTAPALPPLRTRLPTLFLPLPPLLPPPHTGGIQVHRGHMEEGKADTVDKADRAGTVGKADIPAPIPQTPARER